MTYMTIDEALDRLLELGGSDLLLSCGSKPRVRKDGNLEPISADAEVLQPADTQRMLREILDPKQWRELEKRRNVDFSFYSPRGPYLRWNGGELHGYFRAMVWLTRLELNLVSRGGMSSAPQLDTRETPTPTESTSSPAWTTC